MAIDYPYVINRDNVKTILQISVSTYDTLIDFYLPIVTEDIDIITNYNWVAEYSATLTNGSAVISEINITEVTKGWLVSTDQYTQSVVTDFDIDASTITVSDNATADLEDATVLINEFPKAKWPAAAQMIGFQIAKNNGIDSTNKGNIQSRSMGPLSVTYAELDNALSNGYGYPGYIVQNLKTITVPRFA